MKFTPHIKGDGVSCRYCGAIHARPHDNRFGICASCYEALERHRSVKHLTDDVFLEKLTRKLERIVQNEILGRSTSLRCEAISENPNPRTCGYQCEMQGHDMRQGRAVCPSHRDAAIVRFVRDAGMPLATVTRLLVELVARQPGLRDEIRRAI